MTPEQTARHTAARLLEYRPIIDWLQQHLIGEVKVFSTYEIKEPVPPIRCVDGSTLSAQANTRTYCTPENNTGPWTHVEIGYPSVLPPSSWDEYADGSGIYARVPIKLVAEYIWHHGGVADEQVEP